MSRLNWVHSVRFSSVNEFRSRRRQKFTKVCSQPGPAGRGASRDPLWETLTTCSSEEGLFVVW
jgi:hypothetical protein